MKKTMFSIALAAMMFMALATIASSMTTGTTITRTGKVVAVDDSGKGITISSTAGGHETVAGAIVNDSTDIRVKGKKADLAQIKSGDRVTMTYTYQDNDLYAKKIVKK